MFCTELRTAGCDIFQQRCDERSHFLHISRSHKSQGKQTTATDIMNYRQQIKTWE